jgi:tetratricopeptide (TPR) repeat protein
LYQGRVIENTNFHGINDAKYSVDNIVHAYNAISFEYFNVAKFHFDRKEYDKAIEVLEKSIKLDPNNSGTRPALVTVYSKVGFDHAAKKEYDLAIKAYKRAIDLNPENSRVYNNLGVVYGDKKEWDKAIHAYEQAIRFDRKDPLPHINLTYARFQKLISLSK